MLSRLSPVPSLLVLNAVLLMLLALAILTTPVPNIQTSFDGATVDISADSAWVLLPGQCVNIKWALEGIQSLYVDDNGKVGYDEMAFCPATDVSSPSFEITAVNGETSTFLLNIRNLPAATVSSLTLLALLLPFVIAFYYIVTMRLTEPILSDQSPLLALVALLLVCLLWQTARPFTINNILDYLGDVFRSRSWQVLGLILAGLVFVPLATQLLRRRKESGMRADPVAICAFFVFVVLLYSLADFESIGQREIWPFQAYFEGRPSKVETELVSRFWILVPNVLATIISPNSFAGYHFVNLSMFCGMMVFFYAILRQLQAPPLLAFLATFLFLVYPVNSGLMSVRSITHTFNKLSLLIAVFLVLDCRENSSRLHMLGIWLALLFNVGSYEIALVIILASPILWWWSKPKLLWRNVNLTVIWYLFPAAKVAYLLLLTLNLRAFYGARLIERGFATDQFSLESAGHYFDIVATVYRRTLLYGWHEAMNAIGQNSWIAPTAAALALIGTVSVYLSRQSNHETFPHRKQIATALLGGLLFILPSVGVLMWLDKYAYDLVRLYIFVPIGAAIAVLGLVALVATAIKNIRLRQAFIVCLILLLLIPGLSRLFDQQKRFEESANAKAKILLQIVELVPYFDTDAILMLVTDMSDQSLYEHGISELMSNTLDSAIYMLYYEGRPKVAFLCILGERCNTDDIDVREKYLQPGTDYSEVVLFFLNDDLTVELLRELPAELDEDIGGAKNDTYYPDRLIDTSAPIPPRAFTLLASVYRDS